MTAFPLPPLQSAVKPVSAGSKSASANSSADEPASFQDALANQVSKRSPQKQADQAKPVEQSKTSAQQPETPEKAASADQAEQTAKALTENIVAGKSVTPNAGELAIAAEAESEGAAGQDATAVTLAPDQLLALPSAASAGQGVRLAAETIAGKDVSEAALFTGNAKRGQQYADVAAAELKPAQPDTATAIEQPTLEAGELLATEREQAAPSDFSRLLAGKEAQAITAATAPAAVAQASAVMSTNIIEPRLGSRGWDQAVSQKVVWMAGALEQSATLTLNPPDLGPLQVVVNVHNDQASTVFVSENPEVRQALQDSINTLRSMLSNAGITLGETSISNGEQAQQQFQQQASRQAATGSGRQQANGVQGQIDGSHPLAQQARHGLVDTFA